MQANEFEKQVHDELQGFKVKPSEEVWQKVEAAIRERKRRRVLVWLLIPLIAGGGLIFLLLQNGNENSSGTVLTNEKTEYNNPAGSNETIEKSPKKESDSGTESDRSLNSKTRESISQQEIKTSVQQKLLLAKKQENKKQYKQGLLPNRNDKDFPVNQPVATFEKVNVTEINNETAGRIDFSAVKLNTDSRSAIEWKIHEDQMPGDMLKKTIDSLLHKSVALQVNKKKEWEWGVVFKSGFSNNSKDIFSLLKSEDASSLSASPNPGSGGQGNIPPSDPKASFAVGAGVEVRKYFGDRSSLSFGLQYAQYSNSRKTGARVDSSRQVNNNFTSYSADYFYRPGNSRNYKSTYHFIEMPVGFQWKLNPGRKVPVSPGIGLTITRLLKSDGIVYSNNQNFYYNDNTLISKTQLHGAAGVNFELLKNSGHPLNIGPYIQFGLTPHYKKEYNSRNRIAFAGIRAVWIAGKK